MNAAQRDHLIREYRDAVADIQRAAAFNKFCADVVLASQGTKDAQKANKTKYGKLLQISEAHLANAEERAVEFGEALGFIAE